MTFPLLLLFVHALMQKQTLIKQQWHAIVGVTERHSHSAAEWLRLRVSEHAAAWPFLGLNQLSLLLTQSLYPKAQNNNGI